MKTQEEDFSEVEYCDDIVDAAIAYVTASTDEQVAIKKKEIETYLRELSLSTAKELKRRINIMTINDLLWYNSREKSAMLLVDDLLYRLLYLRKEDWTGEREIDIQYLLWTLEDADKEYAEEDYRYTPDEDDYFDPEKEGLMNANAYI